MENLCALFRFPGGDAALPRFQTGSRGRGMPTVHRPNHRSIAASPAGRPDIGFVTNVTAVFAAPAGRIPPYPLDGSDAGCWPIPPYPPGGGPNHTLALPQVSAPTLQYFQQKFPLTFCSNHYFISRKFPEKKPCIRGAPRKARLSGPSFWRDLRFRPHFGPVRSRSAELWVLRVLQVNFP